MAGLSGFFVYRSGGSRIHRLDVRFKWITLALLSLAIMQYGPLPLAAISLLLLIIGRHAGLSLMRILVDLRYFILVLAMVPAARAFTTPGTPLFDLSWLPVTREGVLSGGVFAWRLLLIAAFGLIFVVTTRPPAVRAAVVYFLRMVPGLPAARIGTMMGLLIRFIPVVFLQADATLDAQRARGIDNRRNPAHRLICFVIPFLRRLFIGADRLSEAMDARCYTDQRTDPTLLSRKSDWWMLFASIGTIVMLSFF